MHNSEVIERFAWRWVCCRNFVTYLLPYLWSCMECSSYGRIRQLAQQWGLHLKALRISLKVLSKGCGQDCSFYIIHS